MLLATLYDSMVFLDLFVGSITVNLIHFLVFFMVLKLDFYIYF